MTGGGLTRDHKLVLAGLARGRAMDEIGQDLHIAGETVRTRLYRIRKRVGARSSAHAVAIAYESGWLSDLRPEYRPPLQLTDKQLAVLQCVAQGLTRDETAKCLGISTNSMSVRLRRACRDLLASNRCHAVALAYQHGLLPVRPAPP